MKDERLAIECALQRAEEGLALLTSRRQIAPYTAEDTRPVRRAETAGDFLLEFHHPQITFRPIIIERHREVIHEAQDFIAAALQTVD